MKKSKLIAGLSTTFLSVIALASCAITVKAKEGVVLTINGEPYTAEQLFADQKGASKAEAEFNAVYKVAIRNYFTKNQPGYDKMTQIGKQTTTKINGEKLTAQSNADKNGTSYDTEWNKILTNNGVTDEQGLYDKFEYDLQKSEFEDQFYDNKDIFNKLKTGKDFYLDDKIATSEYKDTEKLNGYTATKSPYHVKHILVKVGAADGNNTTGEITAADAIKLSNVIKAFAEGNKTFAQISNIYNDDSTAKTNNGDLGIMDKDTNFVNDFKLGIYMYESYFNHSTNHDGTEETEYRPYNTSNAKEGLFGANSTSKASSYAQKISTLGDPTTSNDSTSEEGTGIGVIPFEAALALGESAYKTSSQGDYTKGVANIDFKSQKFDKIPEATDSAKFYPRNVLFNKYFNKHNVMVIVPSSLKTYNDDSIKGANGTIASTGHTKRLKEDYSTCLTENQYFKDTYPGFDGTKLKNKEKIRLNNATQTQDYTNVLHDDEGRVILVFRSGTSGDGSYQGIHFVCIERSPFIGTEYADNDTAGKKAQKLEDYYTRYYPGQSDYPKDGDGNDLPTYVNAIGGEAKDLKTRADAVKSKIKGYNTNLNTYIYRYLLVKGNISFGTSEVASTVKKEIDNWITYTKREGTKFDTGKSWDESWKTYYNSLETKIKERKEIQLGTDNYLCDLVPEVCVSVFRDHNGETHKDWLKDMFETGGIFHA